MSTGLAEPTVHPSVTGLRQALGVGSVLAALGSLGYIALNFSGGSPREAYALPANFVACSIATAGIVLLTLAMMRWRSGLPQWAVLTGAAGLAFTAANAWFFGTGIIAVADSTDDETFEQIGMSSWIMVMAAPKMVLCLVAFGVMAVAGWRSRAVPRSAAASFGAAGVLSLIPPHAPGVLFAALGLFLVSRADLQGR